MSIESAACATTRRRLSALIAIAVSTVALTLSAQETHDVRQQEEDEGRVTLIEGGIESDGTGARGVFASLGVPIGEKDMIIAALGHTTFDDFEVEVEVPTPGGGSTGSGSTVRVVEVEARPADRIFLGYRHGIGDYGLNFGVERWGNDDLLEIDDFSGGFDFEAENTDWFFDLIRRTADFSRVRGDRTRSLDAWGVGAGVDYYTEASDFYLALTYFDYGDDLSGEDGAALGAISPLSVADSLVERGVLVGGEHQFEIWSFGMEASWYRSGVGSVQTKSLAAIFGLPISRRVDLSLTIGGSKSEDSETTGYGVLALRCALGGEI